MFVLLFVFAVSVTDVFGYYIADLTLPAKTQKASEYTFEKCLSKRKILYGDQCWDLLTRGPCDEGQWLVLDWSNEDGHRQHPVKAKCTERRCSESEVYWPWDGLCYNANTARNRLCPHQDTELVTDEFGDGYCECRIGDRVPYVRVVTADDEDDQRSQSCYPMYTKGPCPRGHVISPTGWGYGNCTVDICTAKRQWSDSSSPERSRWQRQQQPTMIPWTNGLCYELGTRGPCHGTEQFAVLPNTMRPGCVSPVTVLDLFSNKQPETTATPQPCYTNHLGACVDAVEIATNDTSFGFGEQLRESAERHRKRDKRKKRRGRPDSIRTYNRR